MYIVQAFGMLGVWLLELATVLAISLVAVAVVKDIDVKNRDLPTKLMFWGSEALGLLGILLIIACSFAPGVSLSIDEFLALNLGLRGYVFISVQLAFATTFFMLPPLGTFLHAEKVIDRKALDECGAASIIALLFSAGLLLFLLVMRWDFFWKGFTALPEILGIISQ